MRLIWNILIGLLILALLVGCDELGMKLGRGTTGTVGMPCKEAEKDRMIGWPKFRAAGVLREREVIRDVIRSSDCLLVKERRVFLTEPIARFTGKAWLHDNTRQFEVRKAVWNSVESERYLVGGARNLIVVFELTLEKG